MITTQVNLDVFFKQMTNITEYSIGFTEGVERGMGNLIQKIGQLAVDNIKEYIDSSARVNPQALHHVYEWYQTGSPDARLFDVEYTKNGMSGVFVFANFKQSLSVRNGSNVPFANKAESMENGERLVIKPKSSKVLAFESNGEEVFTQKPVIISEAGGGETTNSFEKIFESFFNNYFSQSFLQTSGLYDYLSKPTDYKKNVRAGSRGGRSVGISTGQAWVTKAGGKI